MAKKDFIDLGEKMGECCVPSSPSDEKDKVYYPSMYLRDVKGLKLGKEGEATIKYRVREKTERENKDGEQINYDIEILAISAPGLQEEKSGDRNSEDAIKKGLDDELDEE